MIKLFYCPYSRAIRSLWLLEELGEPYKRVTINIHDDDARTDPAFRVASPTGKVPAIEDGDVKISESAAIGLYLADKYPLAGLAPGIESPKRGAYLYWMFFVPSILEPSVMEHIRGNEPNRFQNSWGSFDTTVDILNAALAEGPWLLGDQFTAADTLVGSSLHFLQSIDVWPDEASHVAYVDRCLARPAYQQALEIEEQEKAALGI